MKDPFAGSIVGGMKRRRNSAIGAGGLHICPACGSPLVQPVRWEQAEGRGRWWVTRRCPECAWACDSVHGQREVDDFDEQLERDTAELALDLHMLERENMAELADRFAAALAADLITADDFGYE